MVFKAIPASAPLSNRKIDIVLRDVVLPEEAVEWSKHPSSKAGHPPIVKVDLTLSGRWVTYVSLICSSASASIIVGLHFATGEGAVASWRLPNEFRLGKTTTNKLSALIRQISGQWMNDGKQINILNGSGSCSVGFPMPCCLRAKSQLGVPPAWLMRMFLRRVIGAAAKQKAINNRQAVPYVELPDAAVDLVSEMWGHPVIPDRPKREGKYTYKKCHKRYKKLTRGGRHTLTKAMFKLVNAMVGSAFHPPIVNGPCLKENGGMMHTGNGHLNHFWANIAAAIKKG